MDIVELFEKVMEVVNTFFSHTIIILILTTITGFLLYFRERGEWKHGRFGSRINISLNIISDGILRIRTVHEDAVRDVVLSSYARKLLKKAAAKTTVDDPFVRFESVRDAWLVYNEVINTISGIYGSHLLAAATQNTAGDEEPFLLAITWERDAEVRIQKLRVLMVQRSVLEQLHSERHGIRPEVTHQEARIRTLRKMGERYFKNSWPTHQCLALPRNYG